MEQAKSLSPLFPQSPSWDDMVLVGRIARPHGLRGQLAINPETDFVEQRFAEGARLCAHGVLYTQSILRFIDTSYTVLHATAF